MTTYQKPKPLNKTSVKWLAWDARRKRTRLFNARKKYEAAHQALYRAALALKKAKDKAHE